MPPPPPQLLQQPDLGLGQCLLRGPELGVQWSGAPRPAPASLPPRRTQGSCRAGGRMRDGGPLQTEEGLLNCQEAPRGVGGGSGNSGVSKILAPCPPMPNRRNMETEFGGEKRAALPFARQEGDRRLVPQERRPPRERERLRDLMKGLPFFLLFPFFCKVSKWSQLTLGNSADITKSGVPEVFDS